MNTIKTINTIKQLKQKLTNKKTINYEKAKTAMTKLLKYLLEKHFIDDSDYNMLLKKLENKEIEKKYKEQFKTASKGKTILIGLLVAIIHIIIAKALLTQPSKQKENTKNDIITIQTVQNKEQTKSQVEKNNKQKVSESQVINNAFDLIIQFQYEIKGDVYDSNGKVIAKNVHIVYDDKMPMRSLKKKWDGKPNTLASFIKNCKGKPTIGYGVTFKNVVNKGYITQSQAESSCKEYIKQIQGIIIRRLGKQYWDNMNLNQRVATLSYFYNCGPYAKADKQFEAIREQNWQEAAKQMDIVTSDGEVMEGLVERREIERKLFLTPVK